MNDIDRRAALAEADLLHDLGRTDDALDALGPALDAHPDDAQVLALAALCHLADDGDAVEALTLARRAADNAPTADLPHRLCALAYLRLNQRSRARLEAAAAVALAPTSWAAHFVHGTAHLGDARTRRCAIDSARRAVEFAPERWEAHQLLARAYLDGGREPSSTEVDAAVDAIDEALRLNPDSVELRHDLARAHFLRGWTTRALAEFSSAGIICAPRTESVQALGACLVKLVRSSGVCLSLTVGLVFALLVVGATSASGAPATVGAWPAGLVILVAVAVGVAAGRVVAALRAGARGLWSGLAAADSGLVSAALLLPVAALTQLVAVALPHRFALVVTAATLALLAAMWGCLLWRIPRVRHRRRAGFVRAC